MQRLQSLLFLQPTPSLILEQVILKLPLGGLARASLCSHQRNRDSIALVITTTSCKRNCTGSDMAAVSGIRSSSARNRDKLRRVAAAVLVLLVPRVWAQLLALLLGGLVGWCALTPPALEQSAPERLVVPLRRSVSVGLLVFAVLLFVAMPWLSAEARPLLVQQLSGFLRTGALVFGGGHVVLPLLEQALVPNGWIDLQQFLAGYGAAQAVPGPMLSFAAFLGFDLSPGLQGIAGSALALIALFFPSFLLVGGLLPFWSDMGRLVPMRRALLGINASVVGILLAALFQPIWKTGIRGGAEFSLALVAFLLLVSWRQPAWRVVLFCAVVEGLFQLAFV
ncbi:chromate transporter [Synechococcus sp. RS9915]|nr:chromate transporter [Synechococcus sp. RS9915]